jgi:hypothetical protein
MASARATSPNGRPCPGSTSSGRITGDQRAGLRLEQHHGVHVVAGRRVDLPDRLAQRDAPARRQRTIDEEAGAGLAGQLVAERRLIPVQDSGHAGRRNPGLDTAAALQRSVTAAMVGMQMGVDDAAQRLACKCVVDQCQRLFGMRAEAGVDHCRRRHAVAVEHRLVRRQPAPLQHRHAERLMSRGRDLARCADCVAGPRGGS